MTTILILLTAHWLADFCLQSRRDAEAKSHDLMALFRHVGTYSIFMTCVAVFLFPPKEAAIFGIITFIIHFITDYFTSKATTYCYLKTKETFDFKSDYNAFLRGDILTNPEGISLKIIQPSPLPGRYEVIELKKYDKWMKIFWTIIGGDQLLHTIQILLTIQYIQNGINL